MQSIYNSVSSLTQLQRQLDVTGHNIANVDTAGYKREQTHFASLLSQAYDNQPRAELEVLTHRQPGEQPPALRAERDAAGHPL